MPWLDFLCATCGDQKRAYWQPAKPKPRFCGRECGNRPPVGLANRKYTFTAEMDAAIRAAYLTEPKGRRMRAVLALPAFRGIPAYMVNYRARRLGVVTPAPETAWSPAEDALLETYGGELCVEQIARKFRAQGFRRSIAAIGLRLHRVHRRGIVGAAYTTLDVGRMLGWDWHVVERWIREGKLSAFRGGEQGQRWRITPGALAAFIRREAEALSARRVDLVAVVGLLDEHPVGKEGAA